jgi:hypothetical protein
MKTMPTVFGLTSKILRIITVPPVTACLLTLLLRLAVPGMFRGLADLAAALCALTVLPLLAYPVSALIPAWRAKGRPFQRNLAMVTSVAGYLGSMAYGLAADVTAALWVVFLTYAVSVAGITVVNHGFKFRASGHACAVVGPAALMISKVGGWAWSWVILVAAVFWSSLRTKRHTLAELFAGGAISLASLVFSTTVMAYAP